MVKEAEEEVKEAPKPQQENTASNQQDSAQVTNAPLDHEHKVVQ